MTSISVQLKEAKYFSFTVIMFNTQALIQELSTCCIRTDRAIFKFSLGKPPTHTQLRQLLKDSCLLYIASRHNSVCGYILERKISFTLKYILKVTNYNIFKILVQNKKDLLKQKLYSCFKKYVLRNFHPNTHYKTQNSISQ